MTFNTTLLAYLTYYFTLDFGQSDANWLSKPATVSSAKLVRSNSDTDLFLGECPVDDLLKLYSEIQILSKINNKGYNVQFELDTSDPFVHKISLTDKSLAPSQFILKAFFRRKIYQLPDFKSFQRLWRSSPPILSVIRDAKLSQLADSMQRIYGAYSFSITTIEWLCMQDPRASFTFQRPQLPGQQHPGLGSSDDILNMTIKMAREQARDAVCVLPDHFHNALFFQRKGFMFLNPAYQAIFDSLCENLEDDIRKHGISYVSWAIKFGYVRDSNGDSFKWQLEEQLHPISTRLSGIFDSIDYWNNYLQYKQQCHTYFINHTESLGIAQYSFAVANINTMHSKKAGLHSRSSSLQCNLQVQDARMKSSLSTNSIC